MQIDKYMNESAAIQIGCFLQPLTKKDESRKKKRGFDQQKAGGEIPLGC
jgi:hypothetical protein